MTPENKGYNIRLELMEAEERFTMAELALANSLYKSAASSAYYGAFHHARALLLMEGLESKTHSGVITLLNQHFVQTQKLSPELTRSLRHLEDDRETAEYDVASIFTKEMAEEVWQKARAFAAASRALLRDGGFVD